MANQVFWAAGVVAKGDYAGCYVWKWDSDNYFVVGGWNAKPKYEITFWNLGNDAFGSVQAMQNYLIKYNQCTLNTDVVEKTVVVASSQGTFNSGATVAVYLKNGKKLLIDFYSAKNAQQFQQSMFVF